MTTPMYSPLQDIWSAAAAYVGSQSAGDSALLENLIAAVKRYERDKTSRAPKRYRQAAIRTTLALCCDAMDPLGQHIALSSPYSADMVEKLRNRLGSITWRWDPASRVWWCRGQANPGLVRSILDVVGQTYGPGTYIDLRRACEACTKMAQENIDKGAWPGASMNAMPPPARQPMTLEERKAELLARLTNSP